MIKSKFLARKAISCLISQMYRFSSEKVHRHLANALLPPSCLRLWKYKMVPCKKRKPGLKLRLNN